MATSRRRRARLGALVLACVAALAARARASDVDNECAEVRRACARDARRAIDSDARLQKFLATATRDATRADGDAALGASRYGGFVADDAPRLAFAELVALGCCLFDGECARDAATRAARRGDDEAAATRDALEIGGALLFRASEHEHWTKMPGIGTLGADARTCAEATGTTRCDDALVATYVKAGDAGDELGVLRAGDAMLRRYVAGLATRVQGEGAREECDATRGGDVGDAAGARALFKRLLTSNRFDKVAAERLREVTRAEELWVDPTRGGTPDKAYLMADALIRLASRGATAIAVCVVFYVFRNFTFIGGAWRFARSVFLAVTGISLVTRVFKRVRAFVKWLRWKPPVVDTRQARREEARKSKKRV